MNEAEPRPDSKPNGRPGDEAWERTLISRLATAAIDEQRRARRWGIFFKALLFVYLFALLLAYLPFELGEGRLGKEPHTALIEVQGIIAQDSRASADNIVSGLREAFKDRRTAGIILRINSPGGSPVQAGYIHDEIFRLKDQYPDIPLYAVITDVCASGGYYVAAAADHIYADKASVVGSIGVRLDSFGFVEAMEKLGIERRLLIAGENKGLLDPFLPLKPEDAAHAQSLLDEIHEQFVNAVRKGRGDRLADDSRLYSGLIWTGEQSLELGLVDGLGSSSYVARELIGAERMIDFTPRESYLDRVARQLGSGAAELLMSSPLLR